MDLVQILEERFKRPITSLRVPEPREFDEVYKVEDITPERAMELIAATWAKYQNGRNFYPTDIQKIKRYADMMQRGEWQFDPQARIDVTDGTITGGRHRLHALLLSHTTQRSTVVYRTKKES